MAAMDPTVKMSYFFGRGLNLGNDLHIGEHDHSRWEQEAEEEDVQDENLSPNLHFTGVRNISRMSTLYLISQALSETSFHQHGHYLSLKVFL